MNQPPARKSVGGRRPRRRLPHTRLFPDHAGHPVHALVLSPAGLDCHLVSLQVYPLGPLSDPLAIARGLLAYDLARDYGDKSPRVDVYSPQPSIEACMAHQRAEKEYRKESGGLYIVPTWQRGRADFVAASRVGHRDFIVMIDADCHDWDAVRAKGVNVVLFDWVGRPEEEEEEDGVLPPGEDPLVLRGLVTRGEEEMLHEEWGPGKMTEEERRKDRRVYFARFFRDLSFWLPECYGGYLECEDCEEEVVHERCRVKENGHRMNEETGICVTFEEFADGEADGEGGREEVLG